MTTLLKFRLRSTMAWLLGFVLVYGCGPTMPRVNLGKDYEFSVNRCIGIYVEPSGRDSLDLSFSAAANLYFISLGYKTIDINRAIKSDPESFKAWSRYPDRADSLLLISGNFPAATALAAFRPAWDSIPFYLADKHITRARVDEYQNTYIMALRLTSEMRLFDVPTRSLILDKSTMDTACSFHKADENLPSITEYPWMVAGRQVAQQFADIPVCMWEDTTHPAYVLPVVFHVDKSYRDQFPTDWSERLQRRLLFANDMFRREFGIGLEFAGAQEWDTKFESSIFYTLRKVDNIPGRIPGAIHVGFTVDPKLTWDWKDRRLLGVAHTLIPAAAITAQPMFPGIASWNSIDEALTLVHELGHVLGAGHASDPASVMYPTAGALGYTFDELNKRIIDSMKVNFLTSSQQVRDERYLTAVSAARTSPVTKNSAAILSIAAEAADYLQREYHEVLFGTPAHIPPADSMPAPKPAKGKAKKTKKHQTVSVPVVETEHVIACPDSSLRNAIAGHLAFKREDYPNAIMYFNKSEEFDPEFGEVHAYQHRALRRIGKAQESADHLAKATKCGMAWAIDE